MNNLFFILKPRRQLVKFNRLPFEKSLFNRPTFKRPIFKRPFLLGLSMLSSLVLYACNSSSDLAKGKDSSRPVSAFKLATQNMLYDFSNDSPQVSYLKYLLAQGKNQDYFNIVQLGDSHTAGDAMSSSTRKALQAVYGIGSIGFIEPFNVEGQYNSQVSYQTKSVSVINARKTKDYDYYFGGYIASFIEGAEANYKVPNITDNSTGYIAARCTTQRTCSLVVASKQGIQEVELTTNWDLQPLTLSKDFSLISQNDNLEVAGLYQTNQQKGLSYTSIGSNGATISYLDAWGSNWPRTLALLEPNLVILAYGTNESFAKVNVKDYKDKYNKLIKSIRFYNPQAAILILSNPDSLNKIYPNLKNVACHGKQHAGVQQIHQALKEIAKANKTLYWDWQGAMGGQCSMESAVASGVAKADGVHFATRAYRDFGVKLAKDLMAVRDWKK